MRRHNVGGEIFPESSDRLRANSCHLAAVSLTACLIKAKQPTRKQKNEFRLFADFIMARRFSA